MAKVRSAESEPTAAPASRMPIGPGPLRVAAWVGAAAIAAVCIAAPGALKESSLRTLASIFMFAALAQAWNIIGGFAGYPSFGNVVFFGLGGYTVASLMAKAGWPFWPSLLAAAAVGFVFAVLMGLPVLRLRGHYFAIATLGVAEAMREIVINTPRVTGGGSGITVPALGTQATTAYPGNRAFYFYFLVLAALASAAVWAIGRSRFGFALRAIHQDEESAASAGINTTRMKTLAFGVNGLISALAGGIFAFQQVTIYPARLFSVEITVLMVVMVVIGGAGTVLGPIIGAAALQFASEYLRRNYVDIHTLIFGAIIVLAVLFLPEGVVSFARRAWRERRVSFRETVGRYKL